MPTVFKKRYPNNPLNLSTGKSITFEDTGDNFGYLLTDDPATIAEFDKCIAGQRGGLSRSTQAEYEAAVKKKSDSPRLNGLLHRELQTSGLIVTPPVAAPVESVAEPVDSPKPVEPAVAEAPAAVATPKVGKRSTK